MEQAEKNCSSPIFDSALELDMWDSIPLQVPAGTPVKDAFDAASCWMASALAALQMSIESLQGDPHLRECEVLEGVARSVRAAKTVYDHGTSIALEALASGQPAEACG